MERLTIRNSDGTVSQPTKTRVEDVFYKLAEYEDLAQAGRLVVLPCKIGDYVFGIRLYNQGGNRVKEGIVQNMHFGDDMRLCIAVKNVCTGEWGRNIFGTREEAEAALRGGADHA